LNTPVESLADLSSLTRVQIETIRLHQAISRGEILVQDAIKSRKNRPVSKGTYYRILGQARRNVRKSILTTAIAVQMGVVKPEDVLKLLESVSRIPQEADDAALENVAAIVEALVNHIVML
jgi:hypothetical protein